MGDFLGNGYPMLKCGKLLRTVPRNRLEITVAYLLGLRPPAPLCAPSLHIVRVPEV